MIKYVFKYLQLCMVVTLFAFAMLGQSENALAHGAVITGPVVSDTAAGDVTGDRQAMADLLTRQDGQPQERGCLDNCASCCPATSCMTGILEGSGKPSYIQTRFYRVALAGWQNDYSTALQGLFHPPRK